MAKKLSDNRAKNWHIIQPYLWADKTVYDFVQSLFPWETIDSGTRLVYVDLLKRSMWMAYLKGEFNRYPMSYDWLKYYNSFDIQKLVKHGIIYCDFLCKKGEKCYKYWIPQEIVKQFESLILEAKVHKINLYTGAKWTKGNQKKPDSRTSPKYYDGNKNMLISSLIYQSLNSMHPAPLNVDNFNYYVTRLVLWLARLAKNKPLTPEQEKKSRLFIQYNRCRRFLEYLKQDDREFSDYKALYKVCYTGRIYEITGGIQTATPYARKCLFQCVNYIDNLDLVSSQLTALHYLTRNNDLLPVIKNIYIVAQKLGIPKKIMKGAIYGFIFSNGNTYNKGSKCLKNFAQKRGIVLTRINKMMETIKNSCAMLLETIKPKNGVYCNLTGHKLSEEKITELIKRDWKKKTKKQKTFLGNKYTTEQYFAREKNKKLLAYYIQGVEAYIIHSLTIKGKQPIIIKDENHSVVVRAAYEVISNQHDGIIIRGFAEDVNHALQEINKELGYKFKIEQKDIY
jgi:hypothetical protein